MLLGVKEYSCSACGGTGFTFRGVIPETDDLKPLARGEVKGDCSKCEGTGTYWRRS